MTMPEAAMHENDFAPFSKDNIGAAREVFAMKSVSVPHAGQKPPHDHLGFGTAIAHQRHARTAFDRS
jgi:hypothetical protein